MIAGLPPSPEAPAWTVPWQTLDETFPWVQALRGCVQDPVHHAEGDVWIHTRMVCEALAALEPFRALPPDERALVFAAALLHDVAKPACTRVEPDGRVSSRGHSPRGAVLARRILWRQGVPFAAREAIAALVRWHQVPFFLVQREDSLRLGLEVSQTARCDHLALVAEADARGRRCADPAGILDAVALFREWCEEQGCLRGPWPFPSEHARFLYFTREGRDPRYRPHEEFRSEVVLMAGLPGAGKDTWVDTHGSDWPVVSLDRLRRELGVDPTQPQGAVVARAREDARALLRAGRSFVWNATNLSRKLRGQCVQLFAEYGARVRIVYVEVPEPRLRRQNRARPAIVPDAVIERMLERWEVPDGTEAHAVDYVVEDA